MVDTIKFSEMPNAGNINNNDIMPSLRSGANVILNNPWTFLPPGTTAERPTPSSTVNFRLRFNTDDQLYEYYDAVLSQWTQLQESAFTQGPFITYTASASLPDAQNLGLLANGILKQSITLGVATLDIAVNGTDYWKPGDALTRTQVPVVGDDVTNKTYVDAQVAGSVTSVQGTANQVLVNATTGTPQTGDLTLTTPQDIGLTSSPTFDNLQLSGGIIIGADGTTVLELVNTALSVNHIRITSQVTGTNPSLSALGSDTNIGMTLATKGTGAFSLVTANLTQPLLIYNGTSSQHITRFNMANTAADRSVTFQDSDGTLAYLSDIPSITPSALTKVDDTNVTLTLGGTPATALLQAVSLTLGWTGQLGLTRGGTNASLTASNGGLVYSTATELAILAAGSAGQIPRSGGAGAPTWSTATYPATAGTQYNALASDGTNFTSQTLTSLLDGAFGSAQGDILYRNASSWVVLAPGTSGQFLQTQGAAANPIWAPGDGAGTVTSITAGTGLTSTPNPITSSGTIALAAIADHTLLANISGGSLAPSSTTLTALIDNAIGSTQGDILYRNASAWVVLPPSTAGYLLSTGGAAANPSWVSPASSSKVVNIVSTETGTVATGTTDIPYDDSPPLNTEGDEYLTLSITPSNAANKLMILFFGWGSYSASDNVSTALFQDSTSASLAATGNQNAGANGIVSLSLIHTMTAGTTSATTFKIRIGGTTTSTFTLNGRAGGRKFGGVSATSLTIVEYTP